MSKCRSACIILALSSVYAAVAAEPPSPVVFAFAHVGVVDVAAGRLIPDRTVIVSAGRISAVGGSGSLRPPAGAQIIDARGKFLIPGLWDMHVHIDDERDLMLYLPSGVTGVRVMWGRPVNRGLRKAIESGTLVGPHMVIASGIIDGPVPVWPGSVTVRDAAQGREAVRKSKAEGADFIKLYEFLPRDAFFAIADEAKRQGLSFVGHVPQLVSATEASDAGMKSLEHLRGIVQASSSRERELRDLTRAKLEVPATTAPPGATPPIFTAQERKLIRDSFNLEKEQAVLKRLKTNHTWQTPTLIQSRTSLVPDEAVLRNDPRLKYIRADLKATWATRLDSLKANPSELTEFRKWLNERNVETVGLMRRAAMNLLAGSDAENPYCLFGFGLHDELALLVQAGLTPAEALRTATLNPARFLEREADLGTIAKGKIADLVLLNANPLLDIRNTTRINAVVVNGRILDRTVLDKMLGQAEASVSARIANN